MFARALLCVTLATPAAAFATTIDSRPYTNQLSVGTDNGADIFGGTFQADGTQLDSFTLTLSGTAPGAELRAVVMSGVALNAPGTLLWQSDAFLIGEAMTEYSFAPDLALTDGDIYFIGFDSGLLTTVASAGSNRIAVAPDDRIAPGQVLGRFNGGALFEYSNSQDVASLIVMSGGASDVPLPATLPLAAAGAGLIGLAARRRRRG
ncbi:MAG: PEP-CTERM sorting domain-containing protein [Pseudomonadota bacterium]|nr:PEP-CTERM sorting domain-containing protein [Pseudomonadota bacterium]MEE3101039.1 PEP-CTERM sorting domain-containing protein [Pseudomonadota bacterium]